MIKRFTAPLMYSKTWSDINILTLFCLFTVWVLQIFHTGALYTLYRQFIKMYTIYIFESSVWIIILNFSFIHCSPYQSKTKTNKQTWIFYMSVFHLCAVTGRVIQNVKGKKNFIYLFYSPVKREKVLNYPITGTTGQEIGSELSH